MFRLLAVSWLLLCCLFAMCPLCAQTIVYRNTGEEFAGPFPSWKNVKTDYGAKGDGVTDDTAAIQQRARRAEKRAHQQLVRALLPRGQLSHHRYAEDGTACA